MAHVATATQHDSKLQCCHDNICLIPTGNNYCIGTQAAQCYALLELLVSVLSVVARLLQSRIQVKNACGCTTGSYVSWLYDPG